MNYNYYGDRSGSAIAGFVLGLISLVAWLLPLIGYPVTICGIIFSGRSLDSDRKGLAIVGLVLSVICLIITIINSILGAMFYGSIGALMSELF